jgi:hypothetical protein
MSKDMSDPVQWHTTGVAREAVVVVSSIVEDQVWTQLLFAPYNVIFSPLRVAVQWQVEREIEASEHV